jgi:pyruvate kinase
MRKTKIVCTMGPASQSPEMIEALLAAGMDVARINMSHGTQEGHALVIKRLRAAARKAGKHLSILLDLQGPKIRVGKMKDGKITLVNGAKLIIGTKAVEGTPERVSTVYKSLPKDCQPGDPILLDDGKLRLRVDSVRGTDVHTTVIVGGKLSNHKGMNLPGVTLSTQSVTPKDFEDLAFGLEQGVDYVALSFVRHARDVERVKHFIAGKGQDTPVIAKIEMPEALEHLRAIVRVSDGIMVARGDLGVELDLDKVPLIQKEIIEMANAGQVLVITATQMLESMTDSPSPTRAEVSDVANAILDGTDAVMLSGETAAGKFPVEAAAMMAKICATTEGSAAYRTAQSNRPKRFGGHRSVAEAVCSAAKAASDDLRVRAIICFTQSGTTARHLAKVRPEVPIYAFTPTRSALSRLGLYWGTTSMFVPRAKNSDVLFKQTCDVLKNQRLLNKGDLVILVSGTPIGQRGSINLMKIHEVE